LTVNRWPAIVTVALRAAPVLTATVKLIVAVPDPDRADVMETHESLLAAVQEQPLCVVNATDPEPPVADAENVVGAMLNEQPLWEICTVWPATVSVPARDPPLFGSTANVVVPLPRPLDPPVIRIQPVEVDAVQSHASGAFTAMVLLPPGVSKLRVDGFTVYTHAAAPDSWLIVNVCPATVIVPLRDAPPLAATAYLTAPAPVSPAVPVTVTQGTLDVAVHVHPGPVVTATVPVPPPAPIDRPVGASEKVHAGSTTGALAWVIVSTRDATVTVPVRWAPALACTLMIT
jgi:hypothetical protein